MLTLFHAPNARSSRIVALIDEMGIRDQVTILPVDIPRRDGSGARDARNPHPEGKVPALLHDGILITEKRRHRPVPDGAVPGHAACAQAGRSRLWGLSHLAALVWRGDGAGDHFSTLDISHPGLTVNFRGVDEVTARLVSALAKDRFLLGDRFTAADLLVHSPFAWMPALTPDVAAIRDWVAACQLRPSYARTRAMDDALMSRSAA